MLLEQVLVWKMIATGRPSWKSQISNSKNPVQNSEHRCNFWASVEPYGIHWTPTSVWTCLLLSQFFIQYYKRLTQIVDVFLTERKIDTSAIVTDGCRCCLKKMCQGQYKQPCIGVIDMCRSCCDHIIDHLEKESEKRKIFYLNYQNKYRIHIQWVGD